MSATPAQLLNLAEAAHGASDMTIVVPRAAVPAVAAQEHFSQRISDVGDRVIAQRGIAAGNALLIPFRRVMHAVRLYIALERRDRAIVGIEMFGAPMRVDTAPTFEFAFADASADIEAKLLQLHRVLITALYVHGNATVIVAAPRATEQKETATRFVCVHFAPKISVDGSPVAYEDWLAFAGNLIGRTPYAYLPAPVAAAVAQPPIVFAKTPATVLAAVAAVPATGSQESETTKRRRTEK
jgi:hypothetical protein